MRSFSTRFLHAAFLCGLLAAASWAQKPSDELPYVASSRKAIVVGASNYEYMGKLNYAHLDAKAFAKVLVDQYRFEPASVRLLTDDADPLLTPTTGHILGEFLAAIADKKLDKADLFVFFFAGHGIGTPNGDFLLPTDARKESAERVGLPVKRLVQEIVDAGLKNVLVIADACRGGDQNTFGDELQRLGREANIAVILGCQPGLRSYEYAPLGHGIFTHALLAAMKDPKLRDPISGALWASRVADHVKSFVPEYTERDYPEQPQRPTAWTERTRDILLGAFMPHHVDAQTVEEFKNQAKGLERRFYGNALAEFGSKLFDEDKFVECVEVLKTLDQLGEMTSGRLFTLAGALRIIDRTAEATEAYDRVAQSEEPYFRNCAIALNLSRRVPTAARLAAAEELWKLDQSAETAFTIWAVFIEEQVREAKLDFAREIAGSERIPARLRNFMRAEIATFESRMGDAVEHLRAALSEPGENPGGYMLRLLLFGALEILGLDDECERVIGDAIKDDAGKAIWWVIKARREKSRNDFEGMIRSLKESLQRPVSAGELLLAVRIAGIRALALHDDILPHVLRMPFAWKALLAKALSYDHRDGPEKADAMVDEAIKYCDDILTFLIEAAEVQDLQMREGFELGFIKADDYSLYLGRIYLALLAESERFGLDPEPWSIFVKFGLNVERSWQTAEVARRLLSAYLESGGVYGETAGCLLLSALALGDSEWTQKVIRNAKLKPADVHDVRWLEAAHLACLGKFEEAERLAIDPAPGSFASGLTVGLRGWILAERGNRKESEAEIAKLKDPKTVEFAYVGLAWAALGEWDKAMPALEKAASGGAWAALFVHAKALEVLHRRYVQTGQRDKADELAFQTCNRQIGTNAFASVHFGVKPDLALYAGAAAFDVTIRVGAAAEETGTLSLMFQPSGKVSGVFEHSSGTVLSISAAVDAFGNVRGTVRGEGGVRQFAGKVPPPEICNKSELAKGKFIVFGLLDPKGGLVYWACTAKQGARLSAGLPANELAATGSRSGSA